MTLKVRLSGVDFLIDNQQGIGYFAKEITLVSGYIKG